MKCGFDSQYNQLEGSKDHEFNARVFLDALHNLYSKKPIRAWISRS